MELDNFTWAELRQAVAWAKRNEAVCGDYATVRIGTYSYLEGLYISKLKAHSQVLEDTLKERWDEYVEMHQQLTSAQEKRDALVRLLIKIREEGFNETDRLSWASHLVAEIDKATRKEIEDRPNAPNT